MKNAEILITGATGNTGQTTIKALLEKSIPVRAMVHVMDGRSKELEEKGVEIVQGDFLDFQSMKVALKGIKRAYFCYPFKDGLPKAATYFARAAHENGLEILVSMSQLNVNDETLSPATQNHRVAEDILNWSKAPVVHIRPGLFAWDYLNMAGPTIKQEGKFFFPNPEARYTIIHPQDIGDVVASLLTAENLTKHVGKTYELTGPAILTSGSVVEEIGKIIQKHVDYVPIPVEIWVDNLRQDPYVNDFLAYHLKELGNDIKRGLFDRLTDTVEQLTGHSSRPFSTYVEENISAFK